MPGGIVSTLDGASVVDGASAGGSASSVVSVVVGVAEHAAAKKAMVASIATARVLVLIFVSNSQALSHMG
jgi:hypothetical protein